MSRSVRLPPLLVAVLAIVDLGCEKTNPYYCKGALHNNCLNVDAADDGPKMCKAPGDCVAPKGVCDLGGTNTCVECTMSMHDACPAAVPACIGHMCQKCTAHAYCTVSNVCLPDGTCADTTLVAYVRSGGSGIACTKDVPCGTLDDGVRAMKPVVKMDSGTVADTNTTTIAGKTVTIFAEPGAKLALTGPGVILEVKSNGADVKIFDLEITGGTGMTNAAVSIPNGGAPKLTLTRVKIDANQGIGITAAAGTLTVSQSTISGNTGGGISISGAQFDITNSFIATNGSGATVLGGVRIDGITVAAGTYALDFNTITANLGPATINTGVTCGTVLMPLTFSNNIIYGNIVSGSGAQVGGSASCSTAYSDIGPDAVMGLGNINLDPMFVSSAQNNFHLMGSSPAKDTADPAATLADDIDGNARPQGPRRDMGADEITP